MKIKYSIISPAFNEQESLPLFFEKVSEIMQKTEQTFEIIVVNDGSRDNTEQILNEYAKKHDYIKVVHLSRNFGQQASLLCGLKKASGDAMICMDADLQDSPELVFDMIALWEQGYDVVHAKRKKRKGETIFKKFTAFCYYRLLRNLTNMDIPRDTGDFKLYDRKVVDSIINLSEHNRLLRAQTTWVGFKQTSIEFDRPERLVGETKYTLKKMIKLAQDGIVPNGNKLLNLSTILGITLSCLSVACFITFICLTIFLTPINAMFYLFPTIGLATGLILTSNAFTNMYIGCIYDEVKNRPIYIERECLNFENDK